VSAGLEGGAIGYLYSMQAFALATVVHRTCLKVARWLYQKLFAVSMLGVFFDMSYTPGPSSLTYMQS
jgi:hypothetical protein